MATASEIRAAHCALMRTPPRRTNRVRSGSTAKIAVSPSELETGSKSWVYTKGLPPSLEGDYHIWRCGKLPAVRLALFVTCFNDTLFPQTGRAVVKLLERLGCEVDFPFEQTCCGQMHMNSGYTREGLALARRFARVFSDAEVVVTPSASCAGMLRHQLGEDGPRVYELSEFVVDRLGVEDVGAYYPHRVTYHPTCHSLRELRLGDRPLRLLRAVRGIELVELPQATECCGFGGTFAVKDAGGASARLADKG